MIVYYLVAYKYLCVYVELLGCDEVVSVAVLFGVVDCLYGRHHRLYSPAATLWYALLAAVAALRSIILTS